MAVLHWKMLTRRERLFLLFLTLISAALRLGYLAEMDKTLFLTELRLDELFHNNWAKSVAAGNIAGDEIFSRAPLYTYWLALNFAVFGHSYITPRIVQHILGIAGVLLLYFLSRKLFGKKAAAVSSLMLATYAPMIYIEDKFLVESILIFQIILFFTLFYTVKEKPAFWKWAAAGSLFGTLSVTRSLFLPYGAIVAAGIFLIYNKPLGRRKSFQWAAGFILGSAMVILPVTIRNYLVGADFIPVNTQGGINFYIGNNPEADGFSSTMPGGPGSRWEKGDIEHPVKLKSGRDPGASEIERYWLGRGIRFVFSQPADFLKLTLKKLYLFWNRFEIPNNGSFYLNSQFSNILSWTPTGFWLVGPLGLFGMIIALREKRGRSLVVYIIFMTGATILFFVCDRFRLPAVPVLCILSGAALVRLWDERKSVAKGKSIGYIAILAGAFLTVNSNLCGFQKGNRGSDLFHLALMESSAGNYKKAVEYFEEFDKTDYTIRDARLYWGIAELKLGRPELAVGQFRRELAEYPDSYDALTNLANLEYSTGEHEGSISLAERAIKLKPYASSAYITKAFALSGLGLYDSAESTLRSCLTWLYGEGLYEESVLAGIHLLQNKLDLAEKEYRSVLRRIEPDVQPSYVPEYQYSHEYRIGGSWDIFRAKIMYSLGHIYSERDGYDSAAVLFRRATEFSPGFQAAWVDLGIALRMSRNYNEADSALIRGLTLMPTDFSGWFQYGLLMKEMNRRGEAERAFSNALKYNRGFEPARTELERMRAGPGE